MELPVIVRESSISVLGACFGLPAQALIQQASIIPSTATSCFACALATARMARCTDVTGMLRARIRLAADEQAVARVIGWIERFCNRHRLSREVTDVVVIGGSRQQYCRARL
jgi:hypothetical protein